MREKCILSIHLDPTGKSFYTASDIVSGYVRVVVMSKVHVTDLDLALQCEERASVPRDKHDAKRSESRKVRSIQSKKRHYLTVQHPLHTESGEDPLFLEKGEYTYPFTFHLSYDINSAPPHAPIYDSKGLFAGVWWSVVGTLHRPRVTQTAYKTSVDIPVHPLPPSIDAPELEEKGLSTVGGFTVVHEKPTFIGLLKGEKASANIFEAELSFPVAGLPQRPKKPEFRLKLRCSQLAIQVASIDASLVQKCRAQIKGNEHTFQKEYTLGVAKLSQSILSDSIDVSQHIENFILPEVLVTPFTASLISVSYDLRVTVSFVPLLSNTKGKLKTLTIEAPVKVRSPVIDWAKHQLTSVKPVKKAHFGNALSDPGGGFANSVMSSSGPRSVGGATAVTDVTGGTTSSYLSYELQRPGQMISNVMHWFGKSINE